MLSTLLRSFCVISVLPLAAMLTSNPAQACLIDKGIWMQNSWGSFRVGYLDDWMYQGHFQDESKTKGVERSQSLLKLSTYAGVATVNIKIGLIFTEFLEVLVCKSIRRCSLKGLSAGR